MVGSELLFAQQENYSFTSVAFVEKGMTIQFLTKPATTPQKTSMSDAAKKLNRN